MNRSQFKIIQIVLVLFCIEKYQSQILLEDRNADPLFNPVFSSKESNKKDVGLVKFNVSDQSLGGIYFHSFQKDPSNKYNYITAGIKTKPTEGFASVFKNNQFSPGTTISFSANRFKLFDTERTEPNNNFTDWGGIYVNIPFNKYQLYKGDTAFKNQLYSKTLTSFEIGASYSALLKNNALLNIKGGYSRANNYSDLPEIQVNDIKFAYDSTTKITRQTQTSKTAHEGKLIEYDNYNIKISLLKLTADGGIEKSLAVGYGVFLDVKSPAIKAPTSDLGFILYVAQTKKGVSSPLISFIAQFNDLSDNNKLNNGLQNRVQFSLSTTIPIN